MRTSTIGSAVAGLIVGAVGGGLLYAMFAQTATTQTYTVTVTTSLNTKSSDDGRLVARVELAQRRQHDTDAQQTVVLFTVAAASGNQGITWENVIADAPPDDHSGLGRIKWIDERTVAFNYTADQRITFTVKFPLF